ncbi:hypothetical protein HOU03_gp295 [Caulobacter phage CcrSC]|uniref:Uncharacterized protein n=1 Tax=Caulobacter phage CcrSC TaxID=2283272 RepID=A0A385EDX6_9CAUD|nr:hypothetical protein HOU03_gp295 [Caulobacter phage CcrSC]AXQ69973.1 hypothetical protein CcrSC_gp391 [Caulobacter phage CcrSC]
MKQRRIKDRYGDSRRAPMTINDAIVVILEHMQSSVASMARMPEYQNPRNPNRLPEKSLSSSKVHPARYWQAAARLIKEGAVVATCGSPDVRDDFNNPLFMVAGPNYDKAIRTYLGDV